MDTFLGLPNSLKGNGSSPSFTREPPYPNSDNPPLSDLIWGSRRDNRDKQYLNTLLYDMTLEKLLLFCLYSKWNMYCKHFFPNFINNRWNGGGDWNDKYCPSE